MKKPIKWRQKNNDVCDSPNLYFAIAPSGLLKVCCDYEVGKKYYIYDQDFPKKYQQKEIQDDVFKVTKKCNGCMYGSYPEVTITARYFSAFIERMKYFSLNTPKLKKVNYNHLQKLASKILNEQNSSA